MGRSPCCSKVGLQRGPWSTKEDALLTNYIQQHGEGQWRSLPKKAGLLRCGKSCRLRWMNYLRPGIKRGNISQDEEDLIVRLHGLLGNRWSLIAGRLPGRTDNEIKNYWNTHLLKKLKSAGINPKPHRELPKPAKPSKKQPSTESKKKKNKQQNKPANARAPHNKSSSSNEGEQNNDDHHNSSSPRPPVKTKVYLPKPIRVFSRTSSYESLASGSSSSNEGEKVAPEDVMSYRVPPPIFEDSSYGVVGYEDDFLGVGCILPLLQHQQDDVNTWERVYDEYLQLL